MLPQWDPFPAKIGVEQIITTGDRTTGPTSASRFQVKLLIERKVGFVITNVYLVTLLITIITTFPLALPPTESHVGTRLAVYGTGILTLVAYKYGISETLPRVPYPTYTDKYLVRQIITVVVLALEALIAFHIVTYDDADETIVAYIEQCGLVIAVCTWIAIFIYTARFKKRRPWDSVLLHQEKIVQHEKDLADDD